MAAGHLHFPPRRAVASSDQHADAVDVRAGIGIGVGKKEVPQLFLYLRSGRGNPEDLGENNAAAVGAPAGGHADNRSVRSDIRSTACDSDCGARSAYLAY